MAHQTCNKQYHCGGKAEEEERNHWLSFPVRKLLLLSKRKAHPLYSL